MFGSVKNSLLNRVVSIDCTRTKHQSLLRWTFRCLVRWTLKNRTNTANSNDDQRQQNSPWTGFNGKLDVTQTLATTYVINVRMSSHRSVTYAHERLAHGANPRKWSVAASVMNVKYTAPLVIPLMSRTIGAISCSDDCTPTQSIVVECMSGVSMARAVAMIWNTRRKKAVLNQAFVWMKIDCDLQQRIWSSDVRTRRLSNALRSLCRCTRW